MALRGEFRPSMIKLNHDKARDFAESPWLPWYLVAAYRMIFAAYCAGWMIFSCVYFADGGAKWLIFLTNWGYIFVTIYFIFSSVVTLWYHCKEKNQVDVTMEMTSPSKTEQEETEFEIPPKRHHKALWVIYAVGANVAILITILYWSLLAGNYTGAALGLDISTHALNSVVLVIDLLLSSMPIRLLHAIYPVVFTVVYMFFTVIYWAAKGTNPMNNERYVYAVLDYSKNPGLAVGLCIGVLVIGVPLVQLLMYGLYKLRLFVARKFKS